MNTTARPYSRAAAEASAARARSPLVCLLAVVDLVAIGWALAAIWSL